MQAMALALASVAIFGDDETIQYDRVAPWEADSERNCFHALAATVALLRIREQGTSRPGEAILLALT